MQPIRFMSNPFFEEKYLVVEPELVKEYTQHEDVNYSSWGKRILFTREQLKLVDTSGMNQPKDKHQIQVRVCKVVDEESTRELIDDFPHQMTVYVNETKAGGIKNAPINITELVRMSSSDENQNENYTDIKIFWKWQPSQSQYAVSVSIVKVLTAADLLQRIIDRPRLTLDYEKDLIKSLLNKGSSCDDEDESPGKDLDLVPQYLTVSVFCPMVAQRMKYPAKTLRCQHLQCFDASIFLSVKEQRPRTVMSCPVCNIQFKVDEIRIDSYIEDVLRSFPVDAGNLINLLPDGSWEAPKSGERLPKGTEQLQTRYVALSEEIEVLEVEGNTVAQPESGRLTNRSTAMTPALRMPLKPPVISAERRQRRIEYIKHMILMNTVLTTIQQRIKNRGSTGNKQPPKNPPTVIDLSDDSDNGSSDVAIEVVKIPRARTLNMAVRKRLVGESTGKNYIPEAKKPRVVKNVDAQGSDGQK